MRRIIIGALALLATATGVVITESPARAGVEIITTRHAVYVSSDLPPCTYEDGSGGPLPCIWLGDTMGNGRGLSYWVDRQHTPHWFWATSPRRGAWQWANVEQRSADALPNGTVWRTVDAGVRVRRPDRMGSYVIPD